MTTINYEAMLWPWVVMAANEREWHREHILRSGLVGVQIMAADIPEDVRSELLVLAADCPKMARIALGGWVRDVIAKRIDPKRSGFEQIQAQVDADLAAMQAGAA